MKAFFKHFLAAALAIVVMAGCFGMYVFAQEPNPVLDLGANSVEFTKSTWVIYDFTPETDGWYLFFSEFSGDPKISISDPEDNKIGEDDDSGGNYNFSLLAELDAGKTYLVKLNSMQSSGTGTVTVKNVSLHGIAIDNGIEHGSVTTDPVGEALEGQKVYLEATPDDGYSLVAWNITDAGGQEVPVSASSGDLPSFMMPARNVTVSAEFALPVPVSIIEDEDITLDEVAVNSMTVDLSSQELQAVPGAKVEIYFYVSFAHELASAAISAGEAGAIQYELDSDPSTSYYKITFSMPNVPVTVSLTTEPMELQALTLGNNALTPNEAEYALYSFTPEDTGNYRFTAESDDEYLEADVYDYETMWMGNVHTDEAAEMVMIAGKTYYIEVYFSEDAIISVNIISTVETGSIQIIQTAGGTVESNLAEAPEGQPVFLTVTPNEGYAFEGDIQIMCGNETIRPTRLDATGCYLRFDMPTGDVTITAAFVSTAPQVPGDVNGDGQLTTADYLLIRRAFNGLETLTDEQFAAADYNGDGRLTSIDYIAVKKMFNGG